MPAAWKATPSTTQQALLAVMRLGAHANIEAMAFGPPRRLQHAEAVVLVTALGPVAAARLAAKLGETQDALESFKSIGRNFKKFCQYQARLGAATIELYFSTPITIRPLPTISSLIALHRNGKPRLLLCYLFVS